MQLWNHFHYLHETLRCYHTHVCVLHEFVFFGESQSCVGCQLTQVVDIPVEWKLRQIITYFREITPKGADSIVVKSHEAFENKSTCMRDVYHLIVIVLGLVVRNVSPPPFLHASYCELAYFHPDTHGVVHNIAMSGNAASGTSILCET